MKRATTGIGVLAAALLLAGTVSASAAPLTVLIEGFDDTDTLEANGWVGINNSTAGGTSDWFQGNPAVFTAHSGAPDSYAAANFNAAGFGGDVSLWGLTPELEFGTGQSVASFWTRVGTPGFNDVLQFRLSTSGASTDVGSTTTSVGVFTVGVTIPLADDWVLHEIFINNGGAPVAGRLAFRYVVTDTSVNGDYIGIDTFSYRSASVSEVPEPSTVLLFGLGLAGLAARRRR